MKSLDNIVQNEQLNTEEELYSLLLDIESGINTIWVQTRNLPADDVARIMKEFSEQHSQKLFELEKKISSGEATPNRTAIRLKYVLLNFRMMFESIEKKASPEIQLES